MVNRKWDEEWLNWELWFDIKKFLTIKLSYTARCRSHRWYKTSLYDFPSEDSPKVAINTTTVQNGRSRDHWMVKCSYDGHKSFQDRPPAKNLRWNLERIHPTDHTPLLHRKKQGKTMSQKLCSTELISHGWWSTETTMGNTQYLKELTQFSELFKGEYNWNYMRQFLWWR